MLQSKLAALARLHCASTSTVRLRVSQSAGGGGEEAVRGAWGEDAAGGVCGGEVLGQGERCVRSDVEACVDACVGEGRWDTDIKPSAAAVCKVSQLYNGEAKYLV